MSKKQFNVYLSDEDLSRVADIMDAAGETNKSVLIHDAIALLWRHKVDYPHRQCDDCLQEMAYYPGTPRWICEGCDE